MHKYTKYFKIYRKSISMASCDLIVFFCFIKESQRHQLVLLQDFQKMPKIIDNYILEEKIGTGQFGDVYKGFHQQTKQEVAIKTIKRQTIKGKFYELLQNQIKVLKTCDNPHIIHLYAIKKTSNNFYLMLEYCNQGDMLAYVRKHKYLPEEKAIRFLCQILSAFQDLVKHKIMHRDFKLANILLHDGNIKIADFGFAKLLSTDDYTTTMLGSPLNMAPEVLGGNKYNSKADIYSIGACVYEMVYGKPPYVASNMVDLLRNIKTKPLSFPKHPEINKTLQDVIKRMLVPEPKRRISWNDLFAHPINTYLDHKLRKSINLQLSQDESLLLNTSKYYLKKNLVIDNPADISENQDVNNYLLNVIKTGHKTQEYIPEKHQHKQHEQQPVQVTSNPSTNTRQTPTNMSHAMLSTVFRKNIKKIMHFRNIYVFLANVSDGIMTNFSDGESNFKQLLEINDEFVDYSLTAYVVVQNILKLIEQLGEAIENRIECSLPVQVQNWQQFIDSKELSEIKIYIEKQYDVFKVFNESLMPSIKKKYIDGLYGNDVKQILTNNLTPQLYQKYMKNYVKTLTKKMVQNMLKRKKIEQFRAPITHLYFCAVASDYDNFFGHENFDFGSFYDFTNSEEIEKLLLNFQKLIKQM